MKPEISSLLSAIRAGLKTATGIDAVPRPMGEAAGGPINRILRIQYGNRACFVKLNAAHRRDMFKAEMAGLRELAEAGSLKVPTPWCCGDDGTTAFLVMEYLELDRNGDPAQLGEGLARLHRHTHSQFGWGRDNTIGTTAQINTFSDNWVEFWKFKRLHFQLQLAAENGFAGRLQSKGERLLNEMHTLFNGYQPRPALLHGDLWSGNYAFGRGGEPVIFDPAVYYGDRETDLAMTELFGGFSVDFYSAYRAAYPLDEGYRVRKKLYNLYHVLNHLNLFGGGYLAQAESMIENLLSELH